MFKCCFSWVTHKWSVFFYLISMTFWIFGTFIHKRSLKQINIQDNDDEIKHKMLFLIRSMWKSNCTFNLINDLSSKAEISEIKWGALDLKPVWFDLTVDWYNVRSEAKFPTSRRMNARVLNVLYQDDVPREFLLSLRNVDIYSVLEDLLEVFLLNFDWQVTHKQSLTRWSFCWKKRKKDNFNIFDSFLVRIICDLPFLPPFFLFLLVVTLFCLTSFKVRTCSWIRTFPFWLCTSTAWFLFENSTKATLHKQTNCMCVVYTKDVQFLNPRLSFFC